MTELIIIVVLGAGIFLATWQEMEEFYGVQIQAAVKMTETFRADTSGREDENLTKHEGFVGKVNSHVKLLLQVTMGLGTEKSVKAFWILSIASGAAVFILLIKKIPFAITICASLLAGSLLYGLLRLRLEKLRIDSSREGEILITELLNNYKICFYNMQQAVEETARTIEEAPNSRRLLFNLSKGLNTASGSSRISLLLREFRLSLNTSWGNVLAGNMYFALVSGIEVTEALSDLADTVKKARKVEEYARRENNEAEMMLKYLVPVSYFLTAAGGIWYFGLTPEKFIYYQFGTEVGLTWFTVSSVIYGAGLLLNGWLTKTKLDL